MGLFSRMLVRASDPCSWNMAILLWVNLVPKKKKRRGNHWLRLPCARASTILLARVEISWKALKKSLTAPCILYPTVSFHRVDQRNAPVCPLQWTGWVATTRASRVWNQSPRASSAAVIFPTKGEVPRISPIWNCASWRFTLLCDRGNLESFLGCER